MRWDANPIIAAEMFGGDAVLAFNPGVTRFDDGWLMVVRLDHGTRNDANITGTSLAFARSDDGLEWVVSSYPVLDRPAAIGLLQPLEPHRPMGEELWRIYDPRIITHTSAGRDELVLTFAADTTHGLRPGIATSLDAVTWTARWLGPPDDRNNVVFPELIDGRWWRLHRPMHDYGGAGLGAGRYGLWASCSPDLEHWGSAHFLGDRDLWQFSNDKVGPGAPPVRTEQGWLCLAHAVLVADAPGGGRGWEGDWNKTYLATAVMLDGDDPTRVIAAAEVPLLEPHAAYERSGFRHDVIFPTGAVVVGDQLRMYYGAADTVVALATAPLADVVDLVLSGRRF